MGALTGHDESTLYVKDAVLKSGIAISSGCDVYGDITMDNLSGKVALSSSSFAGNMREGIIKVVTGGVWLRGNPSCIVDVQGDASVLSVSLYSLSSDADVEVRVPQHVLDGVVRQKSEFILNNITSDGVFYHMEEIKLSSDISTEFALNGIGQKAFCVESFDFSGLAEEFAKIPAGRGSHRRERQTGRTERPLLLLL